MDVKAQLQRKRWRLEGEGGTRPRVQLLLLVRRMYRRSMYLSRSSAGDTNMRTVERHSSGVKH